MLTLIPFPFPSPPPLRLAEFLFSPTDEFPRNSGAIDWDCPQLRVRRDPVRLPFPSPLVNPLLGLIPPPHATVLPLARPQTEPSACKRFLQLVAYKCVQGVIKLSGLLYYVIANRKMLGA